MPLPSDIKNLIDQELAILLPANLDEKDIPLLVEALEKEMTTKHHFKGFNQLYFNLSQFINKVTPPQESKEKEIKESEEQRQAKKVARGVLQNEMRCYLLECIDAKVKILAQKCEKSPAQLGWIKARMMLSPTQMADIRTTLLGAFPDEPLSDEKAIEQFINKDIPAIIDAVTKTPYTGNYKILHKIFFTPTSILQIDKHGTPPKICDIRYYILDYLDQEIRRVLGDKTPATWNLAAIQERCKDLLNQDLIVSTEDARRSLAADLYDEAARQWGWGVAEPLPEILPQITPEMHQLRLQATEGIWSTQEREALIDWRMEAVSHLGQCLLTEFGEQGPQEIIATFTPQEIANLRCFGILCLVFQDCITLLQARTVSPAVKAAIEALGEEQMRDFARKSDGWDTLTEYQQIILLTVLRNVPISQNAVLQHADLVALLTTEHQQFLINNPAILAQINMDYLCSIPQLSVELLQQIPSPWWSHHHHLFLLLRYGIALTDLTRCTQEQISALNTDEAFTVIVKKECPLTDFLTMPNQIRRAYVLDLIPDYLTREQIAEYKENQIEVFLLNAQRIKKIHKIKFVKLLRNFDRFERIVANDALIWAIKTEFLTAEELLTMADDEFLVWLGAMEKLSVPMTNPLLDEEKALDQIDKVEQYQQLKALIKKGYINSEDLITVLEDKQLASPFSQTTSGFHSLIGISATFFISVSVRFVHPMLPSFLGLPRSYPETVNNDLDSFLHALYDNRLKIRDDSAQAILRYPGVVKACRKGIMRHIKRCAEEKYPSSESVQQLVKKCGEDGLTVVFKGLKRDLQEAITLVKAKPDLQQKIIMADRIVDLEAMASVLNPLMPFAWRCGLIELPQLKKDLLAAFKRTIVNTNWYLGWIPSHLRLPFFGLDKAVLATGIGGSKISTENKREISVPTCLQKLWDKLGNLDLKQDDEINRLFTEVVHDAQKVSKESSFFRSPVTSYILEYIGSSAWESLCTESPGVNMSPQPVARL